jgi:hypothetical protein
MPTTKRMPAEPLLACRLRIDDVMMSFADPGAELAMLSISDCAVPAPARPTSDTRTNSAGNSAWIP